MKYTKLNIDDSAVPKIDPEKAAAAKAAEPHLRHQKKNPIRTKR